MSRTAILVSCAELPSGDGDDDAVVPALSSLGFSVSWAPWDSSFDFSSADAVILRATWDYAARRSEFLSWCESVPALYNSAAVVRWNTDKSYLVELLDAGLAVVPTSLVSPGDTARFPSSDFVVKPSVGAGSRGAARFDAGADASAHVAALHADGHTALIQPYQSSVDTSGELALVYLGGMYSHAFTKGAMLGSTMDSSGLYLSEKLASAEPPADAVALAEDVLDAASALLGILRAELLYARVDLVRGADGKPLLLELELTEPSLGFRQTDPSAAMRFASAVRQQLA
ncbi:RimK family alpha-L-glutamate ligase [Amycolatopsis sp. NPDC051758]|uniref:RimK family alpha-L-glutamate ligase n=1 Tax=Amycolatopsis sp. NPDC051758 TaxID=3363935 RepID=UPI0037984411